MSFATSTEVTKQNVICYQCRNIIKKLIQAHYKDRNDQASVICHNHRNYHTHVRYHAIGLRVFVSKWSCEEKVHPYSILERSLTGMWRQRCSISLNWGEYSSCEYYDEGNYWETVFLSYDLRWSLQIDKVTIWSRGALIIVRMLCSWNIFMAQTVALAHWWWWWWHGVERLVSGLIMCFELFSVVRRHMFILVLTMATRRR